MGNEEKIRIKIATTFVEKSYTEKELYVSQLVDEQDGEFTASSFLHYGDNIVEHFAY